MNMYHILYRTGGTYEGFFGSLDSAHAECDARNANDEGGSTIVLSSFQNEDEMTAELHWLADGRATGRAVFTCDVRGFRVEVIPTVFGVGKYFGRVRYHWETPSGEPDGIALPGNADAAHAACRHWLWYWEVRDHKVDGITQSEDAWSKQILAACRESEARALEARASDEAAEEIKLEASLASRR